MRENRAKRRFRRRRTPSGSKNTTITGQLSLSLADWFIAHARALRIPTIANDFYFFGGGGHVPILARIRTGSSNVVSIIAACNARVRRRPSNPVSLSLSPPHDQQPLSSKRTCGYLRASPFRRSRVHSPSSATPHTRADH